MKSTKLFLIPFIIILLCLSSCGGDNSLNSVFNCQFTDVPNRQDGAIDSEEREIMAECGNDLLRSSDELKKNFVGAWELIGYGNGWAHSASQPCAYLSVNDEKAILQYTSKNIDLVTEHTWQVAVAPDGTPSIVFTPNLEHVFFGSMCSDYAFSDATPRDGNMYLFEKVK